MLSIGGHDVAAMGVADWDGSVLALSGSAVTVENGRVFFETAGQSAPGTLVLTSPAHYAGTYELDWDAAPVALVPPRWQGRPALRRRLDYHSGLWLSPVDTPPQTTLTLNGGRHLTDKAYEIQAEDLGALITATEVVEVAGSSNMATTSVQAPFVAGLDDDDGMVLRYDQSGVTDNAWLSYVDPADDLTGPVNTTQPAGLVDFDRVTMAPGQSLGLTGRALISPALAAAGELHLSVVLRLDPAMPDGTTTVLSEFLGARWGSFFDMTLTVSGGQAVVRVRSRKNYTYGCQIEGGGVVLGRRVLIECHIAPSGAQILVNGTETGSGTVRATGLYDGSGADFVIGTNDLGSLVRQTFAGDIRHIHATTTAPSGSDLRSYLMAEHGVEI